MALRWVGPPWDRHWTSVEVPDDGGHYEPPAPPRTPSTPVSPDHPSVPATVRSACRKAAENGWSWTLFRAESGDGLHTLGLRAVKPGRRVVMCWKWTPGHMTRATKARASRWVEPSWSADGAWVRSLAGGRRPVGHDEARGELGDGR